MVWSAINVKFPPVVRVPAVGQILSIIFKALPSVMELFKIKELNELVEALVCVIHKLPPRVPEVFNDKLDVDEPEMVAPPVVLKAIEAGETDKLRLSVCPFKSNTPELSCSKAFTTVRLLPKVHVNVPGRLILKVPIVWFPGVKEKVPNAPLPAIFITDVEKVVIVPTPVIDPLISSAPKELVLVATVPAEILKILLIITAVVGRVLVPEPEIVRL